MSTRNSLLRGAEIALLLSGAILTGSALSLYFGGRIFAQAAVVALRDSAPAAAKEATAPSSGNQVDFRPWSPDRVQQYWRLLAAHSAAPIAVLRVASIHLEVPVFEGTSGLVLNRGVGRIVGTAQITRPGNIGIAGHRDGFFRGLEEVHLGDTIELQTDSVTRSYLVDSITVVDPDDTAVLGDHSVPELTLVTCFPFYFVGSAPQRYIVRASLHSEVTTMNESAKASSKATAPRSKEITP